MSADASELCKISYIGRAFAWLQEMLHGMDGRFIDNNKIVILFFPRNVCGTSRATGRGAVQGDWAR